VKCLSIENISHPQIVASHSVSGYASRVADFGDNVLKWRTLRGLTQEELARKMNWKRQGPVANTEGARKHVIPKPDTIRRFAAALDIGTHQLLDGVVTELDRLRIDPACQPGAVQPPSNVPGSQGGGIGATHVGLLQQITESHDSFVAEVHKIAKGLAKLATTQRRNPLRQQIRKIAKTTPRRRGGDRSVDQ
jgi:transcriptional regulator with XRE-family HTH domain